MLSIKSGEVAVQGEQAIWRIGGSGSAAPVLARQWYSTIICICLSSLPANLFSCVAQFSNYI